MPGKLRELLNIPTAGEWWWLEKEGRGKVVKGELFSLNAISLNFSNYLSIRKNSQAR